MSGVSPAFARWCWDRPFVTPSRISGRIWMNDVTCNSNVMWSISFFTVSEDLIINSHLLVLSLNIFHVWPMKYNQANFSASPHSSDVITGQKLLQLKLLFLSVTTVFMFAEKACRSLRYSQSHYHRKTKGRMKWEVTINASFSLFMFLYWFLTELHTVGKMKWHVGPLSADVIWKEGSNITGINI